MRLEPEGPPRVSTRLSSNVKGPGGRMTFVNEVTELDPARRRYADRSLAGTFPIQSAWQVDPRDGGARIRWTTEWEPRGFFRILAPVLGGAIRQGQLKDLAKLKDLLERREA